MTGREGWSGILALKCYTPPCPEKGTPLLNCHKGCKLGRECVLASYTNRKKVNEIIKNYKPENKAHAEI